MTANQPDTSTKAYAAFVKAFSEVAAVGKSGKMREGGQSFDYQKYEDILPAVRAALAANGLAPMVHGIKATPDAFRTTRNGAKQYVTTVEVTYRLYADDGSFVEGVGMGRGVDTGDKDISKALTYAYKWYLVQAFQIAVQNADPDGVLMDETETDAQRMLREHREQQAGSPVMPTPLAAAPDPARIGMLDAVKQAGVQLGEDPTAIQMRFVKGGGRGDFRAAPLADLEAFHADLLREIAARETVSA